MVSQTSQHYFMDSKPSTSYTNTAEKLAAAAAAASSSDSTVVEIPNFGEGLASMMEQSRMVCFFIN
jgi:hypothetical protein